MTTLLKVLASGPEGSSVLVFAAIIFGIVMIVLAVSRSNRMDDTLRRVAERLGGTVTGGGAFTPGGVQFQIGERQAWIEVYSGSRNKPAYSRVSVYTKGRSPATLHILPEGFGQSFLKMFGAQDLEIGDAAFDAAYVLKANPESFPQRLFSPARRRRVIASVYRIGHMTHPTIDLDANHLTVQVRSFLDEESALMLLVETAKDFVGYLFGDPPVSGIELEEVRVRTGGECPVCGTSMQDLVVQCEACKTPHHDECWKYMGRCSTYACKGMRAVA